MLVSYNILSLFQINLNFDVSSLNYHTLLTCSVSINCLILLISIHIFKMLGVLFINRLLQNKIIHNYCTLTCVIYCFSLWHGLLFFNIDLVLLMLFYVRLFLWTRQRVKRVQQHIACFRLSSDFTKESNIFYSTVQPRRIFPLPNISCLWLNHTRLPTDSPYRTCSQKCSAPCSNTRELSRTGFLRSSTRPVFGRHRGSWGLQLRFLIFQII